MSDFTLVTHWRAAARIEQVADILGAPERLPDWWPEVYLAAEIVEPGGTDGLGRAVAFHTRGWLPYTLRWTATLVEDDRPHGWTIAAAGDLAGRGRWRLVQHGAEAEITYVWEIDVQKPGLRRLTPLLRPVYAANHRWAMARGLEGLRREIARRHG